ncbi:MAG: acyltransferase family protein [Novosphingobium sp.]
MTSADQGSLPAVMLYSLQYLRAFAALSVVFYHAEYSFNLLAGRNLDAFEFGAGGVDVFFVISGLIMWITTSEGQKSPAAFLRNRIIRIVPLYWLFTALSVLMAVAAPSITAIVLEAGHVISSFFFIPWQRPGTDEWTPVMAVGWTLNLEMFFYVAFAIALSLAVRWRLLAICGFLTAAAVSGMIWPLTGVLKIYCSPILLEFAAGILIGAFVAPRLDGLKIDPRIYAAIAGLGLALIVILPWQHATDLGRLWVWGIPAVLMVGGAYLHERGTQTVRLPWLVLIGDASYALYLIHPMAVSLASAVFRKLGLVGDAPMVTIAFFIAAIAVSVVSAVIVHRLFEKPVGRFLKGGGSAGQPATLASGA